MSHYVTIESSLTNRNDALQAFRKLFEKFGGTSGLKTYDQPVNIKVYNQQTDGVVCAYLTDSNAQVALKVNKDGTYSIVGDPYYCNSKFKEAFYNNSKGMQAYVEYLAAIEEQRRILAQMGYSIVSEHVSAEGVWTCQAEEIVANAGNVGF